MMKELTCALVVIIGLVNATPHGYGVKSGAAAKAEAHAGAGAFGGFGQVPPVIPAGGGYSGSYSKSSSSGYASSAASASSSSFSYSGAGSYGANGSPSGSGCISGACQNVGAAPSPYGAANNGNIQPFGSGANAAAGAVAGAFAGSQGIANGTPCTGSNCANQKPEGCQGPDCESNKCTSGHCEPNVAPTAPSASNEKCTDGQCGSALDSKSTKEEHKCTSEKCSTTSLHTENENDIPVNVAGTQSTFDSSQQSTAFDKTSTEYTSPVNSPCANGNCGTPSTSYLKPTQSNLPSSSAPNGNPVKCNSPSCNALYNTPAAVNPALPSYNVPSTFYSTPNEGPKCTSPNCDTQNVNPKPSPSSYNVPINSYSTSPSKENYGGCASGNCDKPTSSYNYGSPNKFLSPPYSNDDQNGNFGTPCNSPNCAARTYNQGPKGPNSYPQYQAPTAPSGPSCINGNCAGRPSSNVYSAAPSYPGSNSNIGSPTVSSYSQGPVYAPTAPSESPRCDGSNCGPQPSVPSSPAATFPSFVALHDTQPTNSGPTPGVHGYPAYPKPTTGVAPQKLPPYVGGFGGPSGLLKPNENNVPENVPGPFHFDKPKPTVSSNIPVATGCAAGNCGASAGHSPNYAVSPNHGAHAIAGAAASANAIAYTGGFGGPPGFLKPFDDGKLGNSGLAGATGKHLQGYHANGQIGNSEHSNGNALNGDSSGAYSGSGANAVAGSGAGGYNSGYHHQPGHHGNGGNCNVCGSNAAEGSYGGHGNFGLNGGYDLSKNGLLGGILAGSGSVAKSVSGALSGGGSGSFGLGGSFSSSGAFSHATSGAATKGGYGGR